MKKTITIIALALVVVLALGGLCSCAKHLEGTYTEESMSLEEFSFEGDAFTYTIMTATIKGTYEFKGGAIYFTAESGPAARIESFNERFGGGVSYSEGKNEDGKSYIKIAGIEYVKKDAAQ